MFKWLCMALIATGLVAGDAHAETYVVKRGDNLTKIAKRFDCTVDAIRQANGLTRDLVRLKQKLTIPRICGAAPPVLTGEGHLPVIHHTVEGGDTLASICETYGVTIAHVKEMNPQLKRRRKRGRRYKSKWSMKAGDHLQLQPTRRVKPKTKLLYRISAGDNLTRIARAHGVTLEQLKKWNPKKKSTRLRIGDQLTILQESTYSHSEAEGKPQAGKLVNGVQMPTGPGYYRRRPERSWGTAETIDALLDAIDVVRSYHPNAHDLAIGDLSAEHGGKLAKHVSHQNGRDADVGFYFKNLSRQGPRAFYRTSRHPVDFETTWTFLKALAGSSDAESRVDYMFISYDVQKRFYNWAKKRGEDAYLLERMFQYPRGKRAMRGLIRHEPGHSNHIHIRFKCPRDDQHCV